MSLETTAKEMKAMIAKGDITFDQIRSLVGAEPKEAWFFFREHYAHLDGIEINSKRAESQYGVSNKNLRDWQKRGWVQVLKPGKRGSNVQQTLFNERDIAVMAEMIRVYRRSKYGPIPGWTPPTLLAS